MLLIPPPSPFVFLQTTHHYYWLERRNEITDMLRPWANATLFQFTRGMIRGCRLVFSIYHRNCRLLYFCSTTLAPLPRHRPSTWLLAMWPGLLRLVYSFPHCLGTRGNGRSEMCCLVSRLPLPHLPCVVPLTCALPPAAIAASAASKPDSNVGQESESGSVGYGTLNSEMAQFSPASFGAPGIPVVLH